VSNRRAELNRKIQQILDDYNITLEEFRALLEMSLPEACKAVKKAVLDNTGPLSFLIPEQSALDILPKNLQKSSWTAEEKISQIMIDRPFQFYLMKKFHHLPEKNFRKRVKIHGQDILDRHIGHQKSTLLLNSHFGPGQLAQIILARKGFEFTSLVARDFYSAFDIELEGVSVHELGKTMGAQAIALGRQVLGQRGIIHTTGDGYAGKSGAHYRFFGYQRRFASGFAYMADLADCPVIPLLVHVDSNGFITLTIRPAIKSDKSISDRQERINKMVERYVKLLKKEWRQSPASVPPGTIRKLAGIKPDGITKP